MWLLWETDNVGHILSLDSKQISMTGALLFHSSVSRSLVVNKEGNDVIADDCDWLWLEQALQKKGNKDEYKHKAGAQEWSGMLNRSGLCEYHFLMAYLQFLVPIPELRSTWFICFLSFKECYKIEELSCLSYNNNEK